MKKQLPSRKEKCVNLTKKLNKLFTGHYCAIHPQPTPSIMNTARGGDAVLDNGILHETYKRDRYFRKWKKKKNEKTKITTKIELQKLTFLHLDYERINPNDGGKWTIIQNHFWN